MADDDEAALEAKKQAAIARVLKEAGDVMPRNSHVSAGIVRGGQSILVKRPGDGEQAGKNVVDVFVGKNYADAAQRAITHYMKGKTNGMNRKQRRALAAEERKTKRSS